MGSGRMMQCTQLCLLVILALFTLTSWADGSPLEVMSAPNLLRVGTTENVFVEIQDCPVESDINVEISVINHPTRRSKLSSTSVTLTKAKNFQAFGQITVPADDFSKDPKVKQYVYLQARFPGKVLEKVVLLSFQSGYIFIQTDKTIYTPDSRVHYRLFGMSPGMKPVERTDITDASVAVEILTHDGIIVKTESVSLLSGIYSGIYQLGEIVSPGQWKIVAKFQSTPQHSYTAEFEVREYVLPSFEVKLSASTPYFHVDSSELTINIKATYVFGQQVDGAAFVVFGVMEDSEKKSFPGSFQRVQIQRGVGTAKLKKENITKTSQNIQQLVGRSIYVAVSVLTESGSEMVEAELRGIQIVTSPYIIRFRKTPQYFKPGFSFNVAVEVLKPDNSPASQVPVVVDPGAVKAISSSNGIARLSVNTGQDLRQLTVRAKTEDAKLLPEKQASTSMTAHPYTTRGNYYMHIDVNVGETQVNIKLTPHGTSSAHDITYLILNGGQLVEFGRTRKENQVFISKIIPISKHVLPSFRIVAYYHTDDNLVVSDSLWVDVKDSCIGSLNLEPMGSAPYKPRDKKFGLKVTGDPGAAVGLVAVDKGVYILNNKHRLTQKKVWDTVEKYDTGCTPGGGKDSMGVFYDAGLLFQSGNGITTPHRQELKCSTSGRRKRASSVMGVRTSLISQYRDELQRECCLDGMRPTPLSYNCERRSEYIIDGAACVQAFLRCCKEIENLIAERKSESLHLARSEESEYMDSNEITSRSSFPESWLWLDIQLPACNHNDPNCVSQRVLDQAKLPDSITTWHFTGISLSRTHGICVADSLEVTVQKKFFIDLRLPYSAVRGEQLEIKAVLHNYIEESVTVQLDFIENLDLCSAASKKGKYRQEVTVGAETTKSVPFIIIPLKFGKFNIEVKAVVKGHFAGDGIIKSLLVVPEGELTKIPITTILDPAKKGGHQQEIIRSAIPLTDVVPNTPMSTQLSLIGREQMGPLVESVISGASMGALIFQPMGCGEQNLAFMTLPVIATMYLDQTNQWESVGFDERDKALQHIKTGRTNQLKYRKSDGSFAIWARSQSSTWLTAYVVKVFAMASRLVPIQTSVICDAVKFLILNTQQPDGMFKEVGHVSQRDMIGDVEGRDSDASMTAFCLIALQESRTTCSTSVQSLTGSITKAVAYLEKRLQTLTYSYAVAMTSYALANENKLNRRILNNFVSSDSSHWPVAGQHYFTLEATAYALLALVKAKAFEDARPVVRWFNEQRKVEGGYGSTQATIMVYQAVAEYWATAEEPEYNLNVDVLLPLRSKAVKYNFNRQSQFTSRSSKFNDINKDVKVTATGKGEATLTMVSLYYAMPKEKKGNCERFDMTLELQTEKSDEDTKIYKLIIKLLYKDNQHDASMTVVDIGLLTGVTADKNDLDLLSKGHARTIANYEKNTVLSEKGSLIIYLDKVSNKKPEEISFRLYQSVKVGVQQPAAVSVYEFYNRSQCVKYYHPKKEQGELLRLCRNNECICAEENCSMQKKGKIPNEDRAIKACESTIDSKIEYVYKVRVEEFKNSLTTDIYTMQILDTIKQGSIDVGPEGNRTYLGYPHCREALDLVEGKTYLIMGTTKDIYKDDKNQLYQYVLGENTWVEYWPTKKECQTDQHRATCVGMEHMVSQVTMFGCQQK